VNCDNTGEDSPRPLNVIVELAYEELRTIAHRHLASRRSGAFANASLATTALVHEAYLKLAASARATWRDESHFRAMASVVMRQILVDRARARTARKHGGGTVFVSLDDAALAVADAPETLLAIDAAITRLAQIAPRLGQIVEMRFFGGLNDAEVAMALDITPRTVQRDWLKARALLEEELRS
jgi:RNA polymerase sigma factor (TIGR02999 family)